MKSLYNLIVFPFNKRGSLNIHMQDRASRFVSEREIDDGCDLYLLDLWVKDLSRAFLEALHVHSTDNHRGKNV